MSRTPFSAESEPDGQMPPQAARGLAEASEDDDGARARIVGLLLRWMLPIGVVALTAVAISALHATSPTPEKQTPIVTIPVVRVLEVAAQSQRLTVVAHGTVISLYVAPKVGSDPYALWKRLNTPSYVVMTLPDFQLVDVVESVVRNP